MYIKTKRESREHAVLWRHLPSCTEVLDGTIANVIGTCFKIRSICALPTRRDGGDFISGCRLQKPGGL